MSIQDIRENLREIITIAELYSEVNSKRISTDKELKEAKRMLIYMKDRMLKITFYNKQLLKGLESDL